MRGLVVSFLAGAVLLYAMATVFPAWLVIAIGVCACLGMVVFGLCMWGAEAAGDRMARQALERQEKRVEHDDDIYTWRWPR